MKKINSTGCLILAVIWFLISLYYFLGMKNIAIGILWLLSGIVELVIALVMHSKEKKGR
ncbi:MAG: hypothetical protein PUG48_04355 [Clostridia bacterium]|nr:hypothetical protein [Clostridia bacterium]